MAKRYTVTSERASDTNGAPVHVIAESEREALDRAARRVHGRNAVFGRNAEWVPVQDRSVTVYRGGVWIETPMGQRRRVTDDARWTVTVGWPKAGAEVTA